MSENKETKEEKNRRQVQERMSSFRAGRSQEDTAFRK